MPSSDPVDIRSLQPTLGSLADRGILLGTSSWKYPGWLGQLYDEQRYLTRSRFSNPRFERECLAEYAETFSTVCLDASYYRLQEQRPEARAAAIHFIRTHLGQPKRRPSAVYVNNRLEGNALLTIAAILEALEV